MKVFFYMISEYVIQKSNKLEMDTRKYLVICPGYKLPQEISKADMRIKRKFRAGVLLAEQMIFHQLTKYINRV